MAYFFRLIVALAFVWGNAVAFAAIPLVPYYTWPGAGAQYATKEAACLAGVDWYVSKNSSHVSSLTFKRVDGFYCRGDEVRVGGSVFTDSAYISLDTLPPRCPDNSSLAQGGCSCDIGYSEEGGKCVNELSNEAACGAAFYNSGSFIQESVRLEGNVSDGAYCQEMGGGIKPGLACTMRFDKNMAWKTDDGKWHSEGTLQPQIIGGKFQPCVPGIDGSGDPVDPEAPKDLPKKQDPTCPNGYKGSVGGEERCIPSYGYNGVDFAPKTKYTENDKTRTETTTKTECALGKCTTTVTEKVTDKAKGNVTTTESSTTEQDRDWCNKPENKNSCASNGKPSYSGHQTGSSGGGGNGDGEDKGGSCGGVNQPPCKIDEKGTPDGKDAFDSLLDKQAQDHQQRMDALNSIKSTSDKDTSLGFSGGFQWLTHKSCMPWNLGAMQIGNYSKEIEVNICAIEGIIAPVMNFLWILGTLFATIARVGAVMGARIE